DVALKTPCGECRIKYRPGARPRPPFGGRPSVNPARGPGRFVVTHRDAPTLGEIDPAFDPLTLQCRTRETACLGAWLPNRSGLTRQGWLPFVRVMSARTPTLAVQCDRPIGGIGWQHYHRISARDFLSRIPGSLLPVASNWAQSLTRRARPFGA